MSTTSPGWSAWLQGQVILAEFAKTNWEEKKPAPPDDSEGELQKEIRDLLAKFALRQARLPEIMAQSDGFDSYFLQTLGAGGAARPAVATLVASCILVGQMVGMHWKWQFQRARPAQVYPALTPMIPTPLAVSCHIPSARSSPLAGAGTSGSAIRNPLAQVRGE